MTKSTPWNQMHDPKANPPMTVDDHRAVATQLRGFSKLLCQILTGNEDGSGPGRYRKSSRQAKALFKAKEALVALRFALEDECANVTKHPADAKGCGITASLPPMISPMAIGLLLVGAVQGRNHVSRIGAH